ncbi:DUF1353 domain-containing protein [Nakamurella endophytica]|uniref:DUF1353 domain-containing protein n=1 Tax=Nakamurella endophytica TaxID=1748367 RepID=A0A917SST9_9ACTN|nr:DUF1353 domain-containing protein [Nakamurella endophytica]GGL96944.1 hypothetical protein GCM10011594_15890 [Nakamurella endophytica]
MPYLWPAGVPGVGIQRIALRLYDPTRFQVLTPFGYRDTVTGTEVHVAGDAGNDPPGPEGVTDLVSVPTPLWGLIAAHGRQLPAALVHDQLYADLPADPRARRAAKDLADGVFLRALTDPDLGDARVPAFRARLLWAGLGLGRYATVRRGGFVVVLLEILVLWATAVAAVGVLGGAAPLQRVWPQPWPAWVLAVVAVVVLAAAAALQRAVPTAGGRRAAAGLVLAAGAAGLLAVWAGAPWWPFAGVDPRLPAACCAAGGALAVLAEFLLPRDDRWLPVVAAAALPVALPVGLLTLVGQLVLWAPDAVRSAAGGVPADPRPTVVR